MALYDGTTTAQKPQAPPPAVSHPPHPPLPRPPPPPGSIGLTSPPTLADHSFNQRQHHQQHMQVIPGHHRQHQPPGMNYPMIPPPPSPSAAAGPSGPPYHHSHHPSQQRHYPQHAHQQHSSRQQHSSQHQQQSSQLPPHSSQHQQHSSQHPPHSSQHQKYSSQHQQHSSHHQQRMHNQPQHHHSQMQHPQGHHQVEHKDDQIFLHTGLNGDWQSDKDMQHRRQMIQHIVRLLKQRDKNASKEWLNKLPQMGKQLEVSLYRSAASFEEYADTSTLKHRLQLLAMEIARKTQQNKDDQQQPLPNRQRNERRLSALSHKHQNQNNHLGMPQPGLQRQLSNSQSSQFLKHSQSQDHQQIVQQRQQQMQQQIAAKRQAHQQQNRSERDRRKMVHMSDINPMMSSGGSSGGFSSSMLDKPNVNDMSSSRQSSIEPLSSSIDPILQALQQDSPVSMGGGSISDSKKSSHPMSFLNSSSGSGSGTTSNKKESNGSSSSMLGNRSDPEWQTRIRHKQQRLLLLHHSSKCTTEEGQCKVTAYCADMKRLWKHMARCSDHRCQVSHCFSSRSILSHYRRCKDAKCPACGPVRDTVRRSQASRQQSVDRSDRSKSLSSQKPYPHHSSDRMGFSNGKAPPYSPEAGSASASLCVPAAPLPFQHGQHPMENKPPSMSHVPTQHVGHRPSLPGMAPFRNDLNNLTPSRGHQKSTSICSSGGEMNNLSLFRPDQQLSPPPPLSSSRSNDAAVSSRQVHPSSQYPQSHDQPSSYGMSASSSRRMDPEWQSKIKHKQQRLLLLRHASKCPYEKGTCPETPHCAAMKQLWKHIADCRDHQCKVMHCLSSRSVLSHYRKCKDSQCPACGPVRETIKRSHEKDKERSRLEHLNYDRRQTSHDEPMQHPMVPSSHLGDSSMSNFEPLPPPTKRTKPNDDNDSMNGPHVPYDISSPTIGAVPSPGIADTSPLRNHSASFDPIDKTPSASFDPIERLEPPIDRLEPVTSTPSISSNQQVGATMPPQHQSEPDNIKPVKSEQPEPLVSPKPVEDHSLINSFTIEQIETHIESLNRTVQLPPAKLKTKCLEMLKGLQTHQHGWVFNTPVDPVELSLPDYFEIIKHPMDLGTIQKRLESGSYHAIEDFASDTHLTFDNAMTYNQEGSVVHNMASELKDKFLNDHNKLLAQLKEEENERRRNERACTLCGCEKLLFEPPVFFCNGLNCPSKRIRRNSHYYIGGSNQYYWCNQCYNELDENTQIELVDLTVKKCELKKKKNDEIHEESWVQCDSCERWIHQICGLFNARQNKEHRSEYCCPQCTIEKRKKNGGDIRPLPKAPLAADLPRTKLSDRLEKHVRKRVEERCERIAKDKAETEKLDLEKAESVVSDMCGPITIRQVTSTDRKLEVRDRMKHRYAYKNYPEEFPFRCKCILVFQNLDGVDVILFALYVYEHGENNPPPNTRTVYISYLDSVHFMRPRKMRTFIYHEILTSYLDYAREKGFRTAHIWACPPLKGDDYIFYAKPEDQKTPKDARLRQWYLDMLVECQKRGIVGRLTNMYELYFSNEKLDATAVPYLEGDYFPGEAENIIKDLEEGGGKKNGSGGKKSKKKRNSNANNSKSKSKSKSNRGGTRSTSIEDEPITLNETESNSPKSLKEGGRDPIMIKLGEIIQPMKESFIVAFLNCEGAKEEDTAVPKEIQEYREKLAAEKNESDSSDMTDLTIVRSNKNSRRKRDVDGNIRETSFHRTSNGHHGSNSSSTKTDSSNRGIKIIDDDLEEMDCEFFNNRQAFLNLCRGNHYQFDELRRAKHTSMMVLWHLHNRDAPKFVQQCFSCSREILTGTRHHCKTCTDFDLCDECFANPNTNRGACNHKLEPIPVEGENSQGQSSSGELTEAQRKERQRNIQLHIQLIEHASRCKSSKCSSSNCAKMKGFLKHGEQCKVKAAGGCKVCKRIWTLLRIHAQQCKSKVCPIPQCMAIRERFRQLAKQQQAMDDRRRQEMNRAYRERMTDSR